MNPLLTRAASLVTHHRLFSGLLTALERLGSGQSHFLRVLTYHRVDEPNGRPWLYPRIMVTPQVFDQQMRFLATHYQVLSMPEVFELWSGGGNLPPRAVLVTFDDAYCDFAEHAWPILQRYRLPVTLFVPTAFPDQPERAFWWDRLYQSITFTLRRDALATPIGPMSLALAETRAQTFSKLRDHAKSLSHEAALHLVDQICAELDAPPPRSAVLGWDALRQLAREGVTLGAHTQTHPLLNRITLPQVQAEVVGSLHDLQREIGMALPIFAYPSGGVNAAVASVLEQAGVRLAFGTTSGLNDWRNLNCLHLARINVGWRTPLPLLRVRMLSSTRHFS